MDNLYNDLHNLYPVSKTLRFELRPVGKTKEYIELNHVLEVDKDRVESAKAVKKLMDGYHKEYIAKQLKGFCLSGLDAYYDLYAKEDKTADEKEELQKKEAGLRKQIAIQLANSPVFKKLFKKDMIEDILKDYLKEQGREDDVAEVEKFHLFTTYFTGYFKNRANIYSEEAKSTSLAYRIVNENLTLFIKNMQMFSSVKEKLLEKFPLDSLLAEVTGGKMVEEYFSIEFFNNVLTQQGIIAYNALLGGFTKEDSLVEGMNGYVNRYNQQVAPKDRLPKFNMLYNQILSVPETISFQINKLENDQQLMDSLMQLERLVEEYCLVMGQDVITSMLTRIDEYDLSRIFINSKELTGFSQAIFHQWDVLSEAIEKHYDEEHLSEGKKITQKYMEKRKVELKKVKSYAIFDLIDYVDAYDHSLSGKIIPYFKALQANKEYGNTIQETYYALGNLLTKDFKDSRHLMKDDESITKIKTYLDAVKEYQEFVFSMVTEEQSLDMDMNFYSTLSEVKQVLECVVPIYNKTRNYLTQKPYSPEKIKINFDNPAYICSDVNDVYEDYCDLFNIPHYQRPSNYLTIIEKNEYETSNWSNLTTAKVTEENIYKIFEKLCNNDLIDKITNRG